MGLNRPHHELACEPPPEGPAQSRPSIYVASSSCTLCTQYFTLTNPAGITEYCSAGATVPWWMTVQGECCQTTAAPDASMPNRIVLHGARPNPGRGSITIAYDLPVASDVLLEVLDLQGRRGAVAL